MKCAGRGDYTAPHRAAAAEMPVRRGLRRCTNPLAEAAKGKQRKRLGPTEASGLERQVPRKRDANIDWLSNVYGADMRVGAPGQFSILGAAGERPFRAAMRQRDLSTGGYHPLLKLARTIADRPAARTSKPHIWQTSCIIGRRCRKAAVHNPGSAVTTSYFYQRCGE